MSSEHFQVDVITPTEIAVSVSTSEIKLPTVNGEIGILTRHIPYVGLVGTGVVEVICAETKSLIRLVVSGGFCSFEGDHLKLLVDSVDIFDQIDRDSYAKNRDELQKTVRESHYDAPEAKRARTALKRIEAIDRLISH